jgi:hypothetical protein
VGKCLVVDVDDWHLYEVVMVWENASSWMWVVGTCAALRLISCKTEGRVGGLP